MVSYILNFFRGNYNNSGHILALETIRCTVQLESISSHIELLCGATFTLIKSVWFTYKQVCIVCNVIFVSFYRNILFAIWLSKSFCVIHKLVSKLKSLCTQSKASWGWLKNDKFNLNFVVVLRTGDNTKIKFILIRITRNFLTRP